MAPDGAPCFVAASRSSGCLCPSLQVREELEAQLSRFRELLGRSPTHVDGHQHVHVLPGTRMEAPWSGVGRVGERCHPVRRLLRARPSQQACARCSRRRCRPTGSASQGCPRNAGWAAARGSKRQREPSHALWCAMPVPPWAPSPATACGEHSPPQFQPCCVPIGPRALTWPDVPFSQPKKLVIDLLSCCTICRV